MKFLELCNRQLEYMRSQVLRGMFWTWITVRKNVLKIVHIEIDLHTATEGASCDGGYDNKEQPPLDGGQLSFFDNFRVVDGVPVFLLEPESVTGLEGADADITCHAMSHDGSQMVSGHRGGAIIVWDIHHGNVITVIRNKFQSSVAAIQFSCCSNFRLAACDFLGRYVVLDTNDETKFTSVNCSSIWEQRIDKRIYSPIVQWPTFSEHGQFLLYPVKVAVEDRAAIFNTHCYLYIFSVRDQLESGVWEQQKDLTVPSSLLDIPVRTDIRDYDMAAPSFSDDEQGLIISCNSVPNGFVAAWPDFQISPKRSYILDGIIGRWGPGKKVVTWSIPLGSAEKGLEGACIVWEVDKLKADATPRLSNTHPYLQPKRGKVLRDPDGFSIVWCEFEQGTDGGKLVTLSIGDDVRILIWDGEYSAPIHILSPGIGADHTMLTDKTMWESKWMHKNPTPGLSAFSVSPSNSWMAFYSHDAGKGLVWDVQTGLQLLQFSNMDIDDVGLKMKHVDMLFSGSGNKLAMVGIGKIAVWNPRVLDCESDQGVHCLSLDCGDVNVDGGVAICKFSTDGDTVGLLRPFSTVMNVWDLRKGARMTLTNLSDASIMKITSNMQPFFGISRRQLRSVERVTDSSARMCQFALSEDGCHIVTCMADMTMMMWEKDENKLGVKQTRILPVKLQSKYSPAWAISFSRDSFGDKCLVVCEDTGFLVWINLHNPKALERKNAYGIRSCNFSADGTRAVSMPDLQRVYIWDLVKRQHLHSMSFNIWLGGGEPEYHHTFPVNVSLTGQFSFVGVDDSVRDVSKRIVKCTPSSVRSDLRVTSIPRNAVISDNDKWVVVDKLVPVHGYEITDILAEIHPQVKSNDVKYAGGGPSVVPVKKFPAEIMKNESRWGYIWRKVKEVKDEGSDQLVVMSLDGTGTQKVVHGDHLRPGKFITFSADGRRLACLGKENSLMVFDAYATKGCIPDQQTLSVGGMEYDKEKVKELLENHGPAILNYPDYSGRTVLLYAVRRQNHDLLTWILSWAKERGHKVGLQRNERYGNSLTRVYKRENALKLAIDCRSPESAQVVLTYLLEGISYGAATAEVFKESLVYLAHVYPRLFYQVIMHKEMLYELKEISVPEHVFAKSSFKVISDDRMMIDKKDLEVIWETRAHRRDYETFRFVPLECRSQKQIPARSYVITYPGIAGIGSDGILQQLLLNNAPNHIYGFLPLRCVICLKWKMYAEKLLIEDLLQYIALLFVYTTYSYLLGFTEDSSGLHTVIQGGTSGFPVASAAFLIASAVLAAGNLVREVKQVTMLRKDAPGRGLWYWAITPWNWLEMVSYLLVIIVIPVVHFGELNDRFLTSLVATEAILVWSKMLYFAQAFKKTGPSVIMIKEIIKDIMFFLILAFSVLFGFGVAFFVLYRGERFQSCDEFIDPEYSACKDDKEKLLTTFSGPGRSLLTMFGWMLGELQLESLFIVDGSIRVVAIALFIAYLMSLMIVLLNLLIAIMGDSYDRVKNTEETKFLKERAEVILDMESMLSESKKKEIEAKIGKFVHVLFPKHQLTQIKEQEWHGRIRDIQKSVKKEVNQGVAQMLVKLNDIEARQNALEKQLHSLCPNQPLPRLSSVTELQRGVDQGSGGALACLNRSGASHQFDRSMHLSPRSSGFFEDYNFGDPSSEEDTAW